MTDTPNLALPYILAAQAQKHVTHNEAIRALDCIVQLSVESRDLTSPPAAPSEGSRYVVTADASGAWAGQSNKIAAFQDGAWAFYTPQEGWIAWVRNENILIVYAAGAWSAMPGGGGDGGGVTDHGMLTGLGDDDHLQYLTNARGDARYTRIDPATLGINATADTTNRLAVSSAAALFNHEGSGHQIKINKNAAADTASLLFQTGFSGRAEMGLAGDDDFHFKVSPDGSAWFDSIRIDRATGKVSFPAMGASREVLAADRTYYVRTVGSDSNDGLANTSGGAFLTIQKAFDVIATLDLNGLTVTISVADGTYAGGLNINKPIIGGNIILSGSTSAIISTSGACIQNSVAFAGSVTLSGMKLTSSGSLGIYMPFPGVLNYTGTEFGSCSSHHVYAATTGARITATGDYAISGGAASHFCAAGGGNVSAAVRTATITGTPAFTSAFASANFNGVVFAQSMMFSGSATGKRYIAGLGGGIYTGGGGASYLPGDSSGSAMSPGWYA